MEDSPFEQYKTKTTVRPTNFFLTPEELQTFNDTCPVERQLKGYGSCSGSYNNAVFHQFPPFEYMACQCDALTILDTLNDGEESKNYQLNWYLATGADEEQPEENIREITMETQSTTPCIFKFGIEPSEFKWAKMYQSSIMIEIKLISKYTEDCGDGAVAATDDPTEPTGEMGNVLFIGSYNPQYWVYETKRIEEVISLEEGGESKTMKFKNTDKILMLTQTPGKYNIKYYVENLPDKPPNPDEFFYSQFITLWCGFSTMFIALVYFEGKFVAKTIIEKCKKCTGKSTDANGEHLGGSEDEQGFGDSDENIGIDGRINEGTFVSADRDD